MPGAAFERAAESARRLDDTDSLVGAAIGIAMMSDAGRLDEQLLALLDEALERIGPERTARRAALLSAKSAEIYWVDNDVSRVDRELVDEAIEIAREVDAPTHPRGRAAAQDLHPDRAGRRRASDWRSPTRCSSWASATGDREAVLRGHAYRLWSYLELGDVAAVDRELAAYARLAEELRMPEHSWHTYALRGMRVLLDGDIDEAERLAERGEAGGRPGRAAGLRSSSTASR